MLAMDVNDDAGCLMPATRLDFSRACSLLHQVRNPSGYRRWRRLIRQGWLTWLGRLFIGRIGIRLARNAACHTDSRMCQQGPG